MSATLKFSTLTGLALALILPIFAIAPLFYPGYIQTHSGFALLWNLVDLRAQGVNLTWTPHIAASFDPMRSDGLLPYYLAAILPASPITAVKIIWGLSCLLGSAGMFLWLRHWLGKPGALLAALVYAYLPYLLTVVYARGAWGEALFWGWLPWALWAIYNAKTHHVLKTWRVWLFLGGAALVWLLLGLSQLGLSLWALFFAILLLLVTQPRYALWPGLAAGLGAAAALALYLGRSAFSPAAAVVFSDHFLYPYQLFAAYGGSSQPGWHDGLSFQLGLAGPGLTLMTLVLWRHKPAEIIKNSPGFTWRHLAFFGAAALILILLQFSVTTFLWQLPLWPGYTLSSVLTYPWQLGGLVGLCLAVLSGAALRLDDRLTRLPLLAAIILLVILSSYHYLLPQFIQPDPYFAPKPQAQLGAGRVTLLTHDFSVVINGHTAGLEVGQTAIPLTVYGPLQANDTLLVNVVWHPLQPLPQNLKVFAHLVDPPGQVLAQYDGQLQSGQYPTGQWIPGEIIKDSYPLLFPANAPAGPYRVYLGLYDEATLTRWPVSGDPEGRIILNVP